MLYAILLIVMCVPIGYIAASVCDWEFERNRPLRGCIAALATVAGGAFAVKCVLESLGIARPW